MEELFTETDKERLLDAVILGTAKNGLSDDELTDLANKVFKIVLKMRIEGRVAEMILEGKLWVTGINEKGRLTITEAVLPSTRER